MTVRVFVPESLHEVQVREIGPVTLHERTDRRMDGCQPTARVKMDVRAIVVTVILRQ